MSNIAKFSPKGEACLEASEAGGLKANEMSGLEGEAALEASEACGLNILILILLIFVCRLRRESSFNSPFPPLLAGRGRGWGHNVSSAVVSADCSFCQVERREHSEHPCRGWRPSLEEADAGHVPAARTDGEAGTTRFLRRVSSNCPAKTGRASP